MSKTLILTNVHDVHADYVEERMNEKKVDYTRFNVGQLDDSLSITWRSKDESFILKDKEGTTIANSENITHVWFRKVLLSKFDNSHRPDNIRFAMRETEALCNNLYMFLSAATWINSPEKIRLANNKLYQLKVARECDLRTSDTIATNNHKQALRFFQKHESDGVIYKTLSHPFISENEEFIRSVYSSKVTADMLDKQSIQQAPCLFQRYVPKAHELRIVVLENSVFAARIYSQEHDETSVDWRRYQGHGPLRHEAENLDPNIKQSCLELTKRLDLTYGAIDMIVTPEGEHVFLEINPNGNWLWLEKHLDFPIADKLIKLLTNP